MGLIGIKLFFSRETEMDGFIFCHFPAAQPRDLGFSASMYVQCFSKPGVKSCLHSFLEAHQRIQHA